MFAACSSLAPMFAACLLLLALSAARADSAGVACKDVVPVQKLDNGRLLGRWVVEEWVSFAGGLPATEAPLPGGGGSLKCVSSLVTFANDSEVLMRSAFHGDKKFTPPPTKFEVREPGRWSLQSKDPRVKDHEMLVVAADPDRYLALLHCAPEAGSASADRLPARLSVMTRRDHAPLSEEELAKVRAQVAGRLGLDQVKPVKLARDCPDPEAP